MNVQTTYGTDDGPWPDRLPAGMAPGGLVAIVYAMPAGVEVARHAGPVDTGYAEAAAATARWVAAHPDQREVVIVVYDGDTGQRWPMSGRRYGAR